MKGDGDKKKNTLKILPYPKTAQVFFSHAPSSMINAIFFARLGYSHGQRLSKCWMYCWAILYC
jgi:hypothetical protein